MNKLSTALASIEATCRQTLQFYDSDLHGLSHLREVAMLAGKIAAETGVDIESAMVAGLLHDCGRVNDGGGNTHAIDSATVARPVLLERFPHLDADRICDAIARHADGQVSDDPLAGALWDADRLTLIRLGCRILEDLLSTSPGKRLARERNDARRDPEKHDLGRSEAFVRETVQATSPLLYHGSPFLVETIEPQAAQGRGPDGEQPLAIYATPFRKFAIPFALTVVRATSDKGRWRLSFSEGNFTMRITNGRVDFSRKGYVYKVAADFFEPADEQLCEWISRRPVKPLSYEEIDPLDYAKYIAVDTSD